MDVTSEIKSKNTNKLCERTRDLPINSSALRTERPAELTTQNKTKQNKTKARKQPIHSTNRDTNIIAQTHKRQMRTQSTFQSHIKLFTFILVRDHGAFKCSFHLFAQLQAACASILLVCVPVPWQWGLHLWISICIANRDDDNMKNCMEAILGLPLGNVLFMYI